VANPPVALQTRQGELQGYNNVMHTYLVSTTLHMAAIVGYTIKIIKWPPKNCTHQTHCFKNYSHHAEGLVDPKVREQKKP
jgi:hypothetical protein